MLNKAAVLTIIVALVVLSGVYALDLAARENQKEVYKAEVRDKLVAVQAKLERGINSRLFLEKGMKAFVLTHLADDPQHQFKQAEVDKFGRDFMPDLSGIRNIGLIRNNILAFVYPLAGNETAVGADISQIPEQRESLLKVVESRQSVLDGPIALVQGGIGLINRSPIYWTPPRRQEPELWGLSSLVIMEDTLFREAGLNNDASLRFAIRSLSSQGGAGKNIYGDERVLSSDPVIVDLKISNADWQLAAVPVGGWARTTLINYYIWLIGSMLALFSGFIVWSLIRAIDMRRLLQDSEEQFRQMFTEQQAVMYLFDPETLYFINANEAARKFYGYSLPEFVAKKVTEINDFPEEEFIAWLRTADSNEKGYVRETRHRMKNGEVVDVEIRTTLIRLQSKQFYFSIVHDITDRKNAEEKIRYNSFHDSVTGLYNRTYFEDRISRLAAGMAASVGLIICDLDGLKLINDTFGHVFGDKMLTSVAELLRNCSRGRQTIARIGGDEFAVIIENTSAELLEEACDCIRDEVGKYNEVNKLVLMSLSIGSAITGDKIRVSDLFKEADNAMYREKLHRRQSNRNAIVQTVKSLLAARDFITEGHVDRMQDLACSLGKLAGLPENRLADLRLFAQFHDIGKVGISDKILFKKGKLSPDEVAEMRTHAEIGHRIALSSADTAPIAEWILKHHEWWNGQGYPLGLAGEEIPLECRILAIIDAYDAMTNDRPYRKAVPHEQAIAELKRCAGFQFDPVLVEKYCGLDFAAILAGEGLG